MRHKASIEKEMKRRNDVKLAEERRIYDEAEAKARRKERRNALREAYKLAKFSECVRDEIVLKGARQEYTPAVRISDVRDYCPDAGPGVAVIGGLVGELLLTFTALYEWIQSNPQMQEFRFGNEGMEKFLTELMMNNDFPEGSLVIKTGTDVRKMAIESSDESVEVATETAVQMLMEFENIQQQGLKFFMLNKIDLGINEDALEEILTAIASVGVQQMIPEREQPEEGIEGFEGIKAAVDAENEANKLKNEALAKL